MGEPEAPKKHFTGGKAAAYDAARAPLAAMYGALHLCADAALSPLGEEARLLCVGAGTGDEIVHLALAHPAWTFAVVEPSPDMAALCREKARLAGIDTRCEFFEGYVDLVPEAESFDGALCLLVSYFLLDPVKRAALFTAIARRVRPGGYLINAELTADVSGPEYVVLRDAWVAMHRAAGLGMTPDYLGRDVAVSSTAEVEEMLRGAGFTEPTRIYQALLISAWQSRAAASDGHDVAGD